jgi:hypothetical protein
MDETLTNAEKVLLAAVALCDGRSDRSFTAEELSVAAWQQDKASFGLRSYENEYPDSNKLFKSIDSKGGLVAKGFIIKVGDRTFRLAAGGIAAASRLSPANPELQLKLERDLATAVNKLVSHPVFAEWLTDATKPTKFSAAGQFWGVAPGTPARVVRDRIANIEATLHEALHYMETRGVSALFREKNRVLCERHDIERCLECHNVLKKRFSKELAILLS